MQDAWHDDVVGTIGGLIVVVIVSVMSAWFAWGFGGFWRTIALVILLTSFHLIPIFTAQELHHKDTVAISILALFGSWTGVGWIVAMVWAFKRPSNV